MRKYIVENILNNFYSTSIDYDVYIIANTCDKTPYTGPANIEHASDTEFFSRIEFAEIASAIFNVFGYAKVFYSELDFIQYALNNTIKRDECIIYNLSRDGRREGKKSLVPAVCDLLNLRYTGSNAFVISLLRNKYVFSTLLTNEKIPVPKSWIFNLLDGFVFDKPLEEQTIIVKNINESASIGLTNDNIITYNSNLESLQRIKNCCNNMNTDTVLVQQFVPGYECEVLVLKIDGNYIALDPIEIVLGDKKIINSQISNNYMYSFRPLCQTVSIELCNRIQQIAERAARVLNISTYARFDFRITLDMKCYLIDIAGTPYTIKHSSIAYLFQKVYNLTYEDIYKVVVQLSLDD